MSANAIERILKIIAAQAEHQRYVETLQPDSQVAVCHIQCKVDPDCHVEAITAEQIKCADGFQYPLNGFLELGHAAVRILMQPNELSREQIVKKKLMAEIRRFPWHELTVEQLDACVKHATSKHMTSPIREKKAEKVE